MNPQFWRGRRVLVTGHTGFKGGWLSLWLQQLGADVLGYSLPPPGSESLFALAAVGEHMQSVLADVRDAARLRDAIGDFRPEIVFHLAAQPLVRQSYLQPVETFDVNVMGTVHVLEAVRDEASCRVVINITSDKCYENREWVWGYRESDPLGGHDPYSSSKGCAELVTAAYRRSFFQKSLGRQVGVASVRAGNVIGGGDFSKDRIVPDIMTAVRTGTALRVRNPDAVRPWQHVLEPLHGYLLLAERLWENPAQYADGWNFGPTHEGIQPVRWIVSKLSEYSGDRLTWQIDTAEKPHEAQLLMLDSTKARQKLGWEPRWTLEHALLAVAEWFDAYEHGDAMRHVTLRQIAAHQSSAVPVRRHASGLTVEHAT